MGGNQCNAQGIESSIMGKKQDPKNTPPAPPEEGHGDILTYADLEKQKKADNKPKEKKKVKKKTVDVNVQFECPYAPMGASNTVLVYKGKKEKKFEIKMMNKIFEIPKNMKEEEKEILRQLLIDNGFKDITEIHPGVVYDKKKKNYTYAAVHPEHTSQHPITGNISLVMLDDNNKPIIDKETGKQITEQVAVIDGLVKTDDKGIYQALLRAGFRSGYVKEKV